MILDNHGNALLKNVLISDSKALEAANPRPFGTYISANYFHAAGGLASLGVRFSTLVGDSSDLAAPRAERAATYSPILPVSPKSGIVLQVPVTVVCGNAESGSRLGIGVLAR